jgi:hypothetical protein
MNLIAFRPQPVLTCVLVFFAATTGQPMGSISADEPARHASCDAPEYRQFDFWVGDWNAFEAGGAAPVARLRVDRLLDGCVLREDYEGADGHKGVSLSIYDASRKVWHQTWVTNRGELLVIEGAFQGGRMVLAGADRAEDGTQRQVRGIWKPEGGGFRETAVTSTDGGKTWKPWFDLRFHPRK